MLQHPTIRASVHLLLRSLTKWYPDSKREFPRMPPLHHAPVEVEQHMPNVVHPIMVVKSSQNRQPRC
eukprot:scaffold29297_cov55-Attheya_sp.AAC.1